MARFNVVMTAPRLAPAAVALLEQAGCTVHFMPAYPTAADVAAMAATVGADAILSRQGPVDAAVMDAAPRLRVVARHGVGVDDVDVPAAAARNIVVTRAPGSNSRGVAEHTLAMILALTKQLPATAAALAADGWREDAPAPRDLAGMRLGLVGFGSIGQAVARLADAFGMVVAHSSRGSGLPLDELLSRSDVLSLHCPYTPATHHIVGAAALAALPAGAVVINTARGGLIDEAALLHALDHGQLAAAGLDVFEQEPPPPGYALRHHPKVLATPHTAGTTPASLERMGVMAAECIVAVLTGAAMPPDRIVHA